MNKVLLIAVIIGIVIIGLGGFVYSRVLSTQNTDTGNSSVTQNPNQPQPTLPSGGVTMTLTGKYICLSHKDTSGPQTMECAYGIKAEDGNNYALSMKDSEMMKFQTEKSITVEGHVTPLEALSNDHWYKYDIRGIMQVESIIE